MQPNYMRPRKATHDVMTSVVGSIILDPRAVRQSTPATIRKGK